MTIFDPIKEQEKVFFQGRQDHLDQLERAQNLAQQVMVLQNSSGYREFVKTIEDLQEYATRKLLSATDSVKMHQLQGEVQAYQNILNVMRNTKNARDTLAGQLEAAQDEVSQLAGAKGRATPSKEIWRSR